MKGYDPKGSKEVNFDDIYNSIARAEVRAVAMEARRKEERKAMGNPSTTVYKLTREIRALGKQ
jgi:hypothetical protein